MPGEWIPDIHVSRGFSHTNIPDVLHLDVCQAQDRDSKVW